jgi:hypothetical protein
MRIAAIGAFLVFCACGGGQDRSSTQSAMELQLAKARAAIASSADGKVTICHVPPGNPEGAHEITIGEPAVTAHITQHGDVVGSCCEALGECCVPVEGACEADEECCGNGDLICVEGRCVTP